MSHLVVTLMVIICSFLFRMVAGHSSSQLWSARQFTYWGGKFAVFIYTSSFFRYFTFFLYRIQLYENKRLTYLVPRKRFFHIQEDWRVALKEVQPSAKREGFATGTNIFLTVSRSGILDPGSSAFLTLELGSRILDRFFSDPRSRIPDQKPIFLIA